MIQIDRSVSQSDAQIPDLIPAVLRQLVRLRLCQELHENEFAAKLRRLSEEDLKPLGLELQVQDLPDGATCFLIKQRGSDKIRETIECPRMSGFSPRVAAA